MKRILLLLVVIICVYLISTATSLSSPKGFTNCINNSISDDARRLDDIKKIQDIDQRQKKVCEGWEISNNNINQCIQTLKENKLAYFIATNFTHVKDLENQIVNLPDYCQ